MITFTDRFRKHTYGTIKLVAALVMSLYDNVFFDIGQYNLVIANAQLEDDADFQCQVSATDTTSGLQSAMAHLTVERKWPCYSNPFN